MNDRQHNPTEFLNPSEFVDCTDATVRLVAGQLAPPGSQDVVVARACYEFVRDQVAHTIDAGGGPVTARASEALRLRTGLCYSKSHLLAALLRARGVPAGLCYQRLSIGGHGPPYCLHSFNAVYLRGHGCYRVDARGNRDGVEAGFEPPVERLACAPSAAIGEREIEGVFAEPLPIVVERLRRHRESAALWGDLPDWV